MPPTAGAGVIIADYDSEWPLRFEEERARISAALGRRAVGIEHIGSTAVPGLAAKPIIDIMPGVRRLSDADACVPAMTRLGYEYVPEYEALIPQRRYFRLGPPAARACHCHMVEFECDFWCRHIAFRDALRGDPGIAAEYERVKRDLAASLPTDEYTEGKSEFIRAVEARALASAACVVGI